MLSGKTVLVTGANGTLGRAAVAAACEYGATVLATDLAFTAATPATEHIDVDLGDLTATRAAFAHHTDIDCVLNIAGGFAMGVQVHEHDERHWQEMFALNVETLRNATTTLVPHMIARGRGTIVNVAALSAHAGQARLSAYCAAKSTVMRLTESLAAELKDYGINVNAVLPSIIDTPRNRADMPEADFSRWVAAPDLAAVMCFLASDVARAMHGALVPVAGLS